MPETKTYAPGASPREPAAIELLAGKQENSVKEKLAPGASPRGPATIELHPKNPKKPKTPRPVLDLAIQQPLDFAP